MDYLISVGDSNDLGLLVWDWKKEQRVTSNKLGKPVSHLAFSPNNDFFVTAGLDHLKFWYFDEHGKVIVTTAPGQKEAIMESKKADVNKVKVKSFVGVAI
jgi:WD40 repeat protein